MKTHLPLFSILTFLACALPSCRHAGGDNDFKWAKTGTVADSLTQVADRAIYTFQHGRLDSAVALLSDVARRYPDNKEITGRADFFRGYLEYSSGSEERGMARIDSLCQHTDSASHPYLYNRLSKFLDDEHEVSVAAFERFSRRREFFEKAGDRLMSAVVYTDLGNLLKNAWDLPQAMLMYSKADSLYRLGGYDRMATFNRMNVATLRAMMKDTLGAVAEYRELLANPMVKENRRMRILIYSNLYATTKERQYCDSLFALEGDDHDPLSLYYLASSLLAEGKPAESLAVATEAREKSEASGDLNALAYALYTGSEALAAMGRKGEAYDRLAEATRLTNRIALETEREEIQLRETGRRLSERQLEKEIEKERRTLIWVCVSFAVFIVLAATALIVALRIRRLKRAKEDMRLERDRMSRQLMATQIAVDQSRQLIDTVEKEIGDITDSGKLPGTEARKIVSAIKTHNVMQSDRETFTDTFTQVHPEFAEKLRAINSAFTEQDIRLARYIVAGLDSKQIAATTGIRPESVKQGRWRLRTKLGLGRGESLEDSLRSLLRGQ